MLSRSLFSQKNVFLLLKLYDQVCRIFQDGWNWQASSSLSYLPSDQVTFLECVFFFCFLLENFKLVIWCYVVVVIPLLFNSKRSLLLIFSQKMEIFFDSLLRGMRQTLITQLESIGKCSKISSGQYAFIAQYQKFESVVLNLNIGFGLSSFFYM